MNAKAQESAQLLKTETKLHILSDYTKMLSNTYNLNTFGYRIANPASKIVFADFVNSTLQDIIQINN